MTVDTDSPLGGILGTYMTIKPGSEEWKTAREQLEHSGRFLFTGKKF